MITLDRPILIQFKYYVNFMESCETKCYKMEIKSNQLMLTMNSAKSEDYTQIFNNCQGHLVL